MSALGWAEALIVWILGALVVMWAFGEIAARFGTRNDWDHTAERKRQIAKRARKQSGEFQ